MTDSNPLADASDETLEQRIVKSLKARRGQATMADIVVDTGIPNIEAERMLRQMIGDYPCHLDVTEDGDIIYSFDKSMRSYRAQGRLGRWARRAGRAFWLGFSKFMKALIAIVMVLYVVLFVCLIVAAMIAAASRGGDRRTRIPTSNRHGGGMFWFWFWVFGRPNDDYRRRRYHNPRYSRFDRKREGKDPRPFYLKVFSFVLGPESGDVDPIVDDRRLLAFVRDRSGAVTTAEIASRTGWPLEQAEKRLTRMVARYDGNIAVSEDSQLVFTFAELLKTAGQGDAKPEPEYWARHETKMPLTGNSSGANTGISLLNAFNLVVALLVPSAILPPLEIAATSGVLFVLHWFPMAFSGLVFAIPLARLLFWVIPENRRRRQRNVRRVAYRQIFRAVDKDSAAPFLPEEVADKWVDLVPKTAYLPEPREAEMVPVLERSLQELGCELDLDEDSGDLSYSLAPLAHAFEAAEEARASLGGKAVTDLRVVFSTRSEEVDGQDELDSELQEAVEQKERATLH